MSANNDTRDSNIDGEQSEEKQEKSDAEDYVEIFLIKKERKVKEVLK